MPISDAWDNPITSAPVQVIGYRGDIPVFPHDLYSYVLSSIREKDQSNVLLLWRATRAMQQIWESIYTNILSLPELYSPEDCPEELLEYLGKNVGLTDDIAYVWDSLTETELRRLIRRFTRFVRLRSTFFGMVEVLESMTGLPAEIRTYFDFRWILSGNLGTEMETALGREDDAYDPYLISENGFPTGALPNVVEYGTFFGAIRYRFEVTSLVNDLVERPIPDYVRIVCLITNYSEIGRLYESGGKYYVAFATGYIFSQLPSDISERNTDFRASFEPDEYVYDVMVTDDGSLNRAIPRGLVRLARPVSERAYIRYYSFIEKFEDVIRWDLVSGAASLADNEYTVGDPAVASIIQVNVPSAVDWADQCVTVQCQVGETLKSYYIRFQMRGVDDYYEWELEPNEPPGIPPGSWTLRRYVGGIPTVIATGDLDWFDIDVDYVWRAVSIISHRPGGDVQILQLYQDENMLDEVVDTPAPWAGDAKGTLEIEVEDGATMILKKVYVNPVPLESDFVSM